MYRLHWSLVGRYRSNIGQLPVDRRLPRAFEERVGAGEGAAAEEAAEGGQGTRVRRFDDGVRRGGDHRLLAACGRTPENEDEGLFACR